MKSSFWTGLTALLGIVCLVLLVVTGLVAILFGHASELRLDASDDAANGSKIKDLKTVSFNDRVTETYTNAILQQPLFFADRALPEIIDAEAAAQLAAAEQEQQATETQALDARLAGIIITPEKRIAMVADNKSKKTLVLHEGMSLEGEQAVWRLDSISERMVSFAAGEESAELELKVNTKGLQAPVTASIAPAANQQQSAAGVTSNARDAAAQREQTAAEIRRRIAERRAQLRAERAKQAENGNDQ